MNSGRSVGFGTGITGKIMIPFIFAELTVDMPGCYAVATRWRNHYISRLQLGKLALSKY